MLKIDVHQHLWTEPLVRALAARSELPFVRHEHGLTHLFLAGERPSVIDLGTEVPARRAALVEADGLDRALICLSSPLGVESLPRGDALPLIDAYHDGALSLDAPFGVWVRSRWIGRMTRMWTGHLTADALGSRCRLVRLRAWARWPGAGRCSSGCRSEERRC